MNEPKKRRTEITIETHSLTIIRTKSDSSFPFCKQCQQTVTAFSIEQIARIYQMNLKSVCQKIESDEIHLINTEGIGLICGISLNEK